MPRPGQMNQYTQQVLGNDPDLMDTDDGEELSLNEGDLEGSPKPAPRRQQVIQQVDEDETDDSLLDEPDDEPTYKKDQVQKIVQTRVNTMNKKLEKLVPYKQALDNLSQITGMTAEKLILRLNSMTVDEQAKILGMTPQQIQQSRGVQAELESEKGKSQSMARQIEEIQLKSDKRFADFDLFKEEIDELLEDNPKLTLKQAYVLAKGDLVNVAARRDAEQRQINKQVINRQKGIAKPVGAAGQEAKPQLTEQTIRAAKMVGMDPAEYAAFSQVDNIDAYRAMKARNTKK